MWLLLAATNPGLACDAVDASVATLKELRRERWEAFKVVHGADWDTRLALAHDRDAVLAEQALADQRLADARAAVRSARADKREAVAACKVPGRHAAT